MTLEAERIFKYSNEDRGTRHLLGAHVLKSRERSQKKKHLVAAALPNATLPSNCSHEPSKNHHVQSTHWIAKSMALTMILVSTWYFQRNGHAPNLTALVNTVGNTQSSLLMRLVTQIAATSAVLPCSGHGYHEKDSTCKCYECFGGPDCSQVIDTCVIDLDQ